MFKCTIEFNCIHSLEIIYSIHVLMSVNKKKKKKETFEDRFHNQKKISHHKMDLFIFITTVRNAIKCLA